MTREEAIANLKMISVAFVEPVTKEQGKLIDDTFDMAINALEQEPKTGHWIFHESFNNGHKNCNECIECSQCHIWLGHDCYAKTPYCPNCGAKME